MLKIEDTEFSSFRIEAELELSAIEHRAVLVAQYRNQHFPLEFLLERLPVDIEKIRLGGSFPILEHVEPPAVVAAHYAHVVGNHIQDLSHSVFLERGDEAFVVFGRAAL